MMRFLNREDELAALEDAWGAKGGQFFVLWGRRRVGKTELLAKFLEGKRGLHYEALDTLEADQLRDFSTALVDAGGNPIFKQQPLATWEAALQAVEQFAQSRRTIVVLDEFQFVAKRTAAAASLLSRWWRTVGRRLPLVLVLAGSAVSFFKDEVLGGQLYGRRTGQLHLLPFDYSAAGLFMPGYSAVDRIRAYAVCGGMPYYLELFDQGRSLGENILKNILHRDGLLHEEPEPLLSQELSEPQKYFSVLRAVATGATRNSEIVGRTGLDGSNVSQTISTLERLQLVRRVFPVTSTKPTKRTVYEITDGFLNFWFAFVHPYLNRLQTRRGAEKHLRETVMPSLDKFVSKPAFESIAQRYMQRAEDAAAVGSWWGPVPTGEGRRTEQREVDAVAVDRSGRVLALGSCKWTGRALDVGEEALLDRLEKHVPKSESVRRHYFFSRGNFDKKIQRLADAEPDRYKLVKPEDLYDY